MESPTSPASRLDFYDFIGRMRRPAAADLFHSIRRSVASPPLPSHGDNSDLRFNCSFLASLSQGGEPNAEVDGGRVQTFFAEMETAIRDHPLWANATNQEIDNALEGLEKYIMTKLFDRAFASSAEDVKSDMEISERIGLLQHFVRPHHLDIPKLLHNEAAWLLAVKELQKINSFKSPREKLSCIMSCCQVINNLLLNVSMSNDRTLSGADDFLPILIYITIKESVFQTHMESAKLGNHISVASTSSSQGLGASTTGLNEESGDTEGLKFPFMDSETESLTPAEVKQLHKLYRQVVTRYTLLSKALRKLSVDEDQLLNSVDD
uniref:VPS9 domain-containing protein n=1 Tax=Oryza barthii TaxID=65489 RepID=A0A0D3FR84_9ORYZ